MLYTGEILNFLRRYIVKSRASIYVVSLDKLPKNPKLPLFCVINTDYSTSDGDHWLCLYISEQGKNKENYNICTILIFFIFTGRGIYLDSFALPPPLEIQNYIKKYTKTCEFNKTQLQMTTSLNCGKFAAVALLSFSRDESLEIFLSNFSTFNRYINDLIITSMYENMGINKFQN